MDVRQTGGNLAPSNKEMRKKNGNNTKINLSFKTGLQETCHSNECFARVAIPSFSKKITGL